MKIRNHDVDKKDIVIGSIIALVTVVFVIVEIVII